MQNRENLNIKKKQKFKIPLNKIQKREKCCKTKKLKYIPHIRLFHRIFD